MGESDAMLDKITEALLIRFDSNNTASFMNSMA